MPAVTQQTPNFLGGVSRQNDDKKLINQVTECVNGYPDPTFGLLKRPGMEHVNVLKKANGTPFTKSELADAAWFFIDRDEAGSYVGAIKGTDIFVWTKDEGTFCTITNTGTGYLTGTKQSDYHFRSVQDVTVITNKTVATAMQAANSFVPKSQATLKLLSLAENDEFTVTIQNQSMTVTAQNTTTFDDMLLRVTSPGSEIQNTHHLIDGIINLITTQQAASNTDFDGRWYVEGFNNSINIRRTNEANGVVTDYSTPGGTALAFDIDARGGLSNVALEVFEDQVDSSAKLPQESFGGHTVKIVNTDSVEDDYYVKFVALNTSLNRGRGFWQETVAPDVSPGLDASKMPHQLENTGATSFNFKPISWKPRETGDDLTNAPPSFIKVEATNPVTYTGKKITATFFYNNRFGLLSEDNVFFGVANDAYSFFAKSALTQVDSDPIDLSVSSVRPVVLTDVLPSPQGLLLFSARQQFQVYSANTTTMTPSTTVIRTISNYEMETTIPPVDVGTTAAFVTSVPGYSKLFTLGLRDIEQSPIVIDISKVVLEWIPSTVDRLTVSPQNSVIMLADSSSSYMYLYRFYNNGEKDIFQAWTKWEIPTTIEALSIIDDDVVIVSQHQDEYTLGKITLDQIPSGEVYSTATSFTGNPCLDMATRPFLGNGIVGTLGAISAAGSGYSNGTNVATTGGTGTGLTVDITTSSGALSTVTVNSRGSGYTAGDTITISGGTGGQIPVATLTGVVYDLANDLTKIYTPYTPIADTKATMLLTVPNADKDTDAEIDADSGYYAEALKRVESGTNFDYFEVKGNFTSFDDGIVVGYGYDYEVTLPKFYYRPEQNKTDFTSVLTISRVKFSVGRTGTIHFKYKADGSPEWRSLQNTIDAGSYNADENPVQPERVFTVPIHQRNTNFELKVTSDFPYPVSLVSMMWEGNYSPRFYRRA